MCVCRGEGGGGGGGVLVYFRATQATPIVIFLFTIFRISIYFGGFQKNDYSFMCADFVDNFFRSHLKIGLFFGVISNIKAHHYHT